MVGAVRQPVDEKSAGQVGGWSDTALMKRVYTHAEEAQEKVLKAQKAGLRKAAKATKLKLRKSVA
jgi:hypothetical protein